MSFPSSAGILTPTEFEVVNRVYRQISTQDWFTRSEDKREQFAIYVIDAYRRGMVQPEVLAGHCRQEAMISFGNGGLAA